MCYFTLTLSSEKGEIGSNYPQITKMPDRLMSWSRQVIKKESPSEIDENENTVVLASGAKLTDVISNSAFSLENGMIVNQKVRSIFDKHLACEHYYYPVKVLFQQRIYTDYFILHLIPKFNDKPIIDNYIDVAASYFYIGEPFSNTGKSVVATNKDQLEDIKLRNFNELISTGSYLDLLCAGQFAIQREIQHLDLFIIKYLDSFIYISTRLKETLQKEKITGITMNKTSRVSKI